MPRKDENTLWVVYWMTVQGRSSGMAAVCEQAEWDAMESAQPGHHTLIRAGITNEGEAERLARSSRKEGADATSEAKSHRRL